MNQLTIPKNFGAVPKAFQGQQVTDDLSSGIQSGFGVLSFKGKTWSIKYRGNETPILRPDGDGTVSNIEVVIVKASPVISKVYYIQGFKEGSVAPPDCFSTNGVNPDPASPHLQNPVCASCKQNAWGSSITPGGKAAKACADNKRLAVVPLQDIPNEAYGGPLLLRVPPSALQDVASYGLKLKQLGYPYTAVATRISFDMSAAFPKLVFSAIRVLTDEEAQDVLALQNDERVDRMLHTAVDMVKHDIEDAKPKLDDVFEQPPVLNSGPVSTATTVKPAPTKTITKPLKVVDKAPEKAPQKPVERDVVQVASPKPEPVKASPEPQEEDDEGGIPSAMEAELDEQLAALMPND